MTKEVISRFSQSMEMEWKMFLILSGIIAEFTDVHVKRRLQRSTYDLAQFVGGDKLQVSPGISFKVNSV